jgi:hypothetical protein
VDLNKAQFCLFFYMGMKLGSSSDRQIVDWCSDEAPAECLNLRERRRIWSKARNEEVHNLLTSPKIIKGIQ